jgi:hypothetical protein
VGVVSHAPSAPEHNYRVCFADGAEESFRRAGPTIFKHVQAEVPGGRDSTDLYRFVIYRCIIGSTVYGLSQEGSDTDGRGFYLPPADLEWSLAGVPDQLETENEEVYWEIEKFIRLALKANPNVLECLYSPLVETCTPLASELIEIRHIFLSQYVRICWVCPMSGGRTTEYFSVISSGRPTIPVRMIWSTWHRCFEPPRRSSARSRKPTQPKFCPAVSSLKRKKVLRALRDASAIPRKTMDSETRRAATRLLQMPLRCGIGWCGIRANYSAGTTFLFRNGTLAKSSRK